MGYYDTVYIAGEAKSHSVAITVKQLLEHSDLSDKILILKNCMSPITGFEHLADRIYSQLRPNQFIEA
jgi:nicotinamidase-related amidase